MPKYKPRQKYDIVQSHGMYRGVSDESAAMISDMYAENIEEFFFDDNNLLRSRDPWETINGANDEWSYVSPDDPAHGRQWDGIGDFVEFEKTDNGKVRLHSQAGICTVDTTDSFPSGTSYEFTLPSAQGEFLGIAIVNPIASDADDYGFLVFTPYRMYRVDLGSGTLTQVVDFESDISDQHFPVRQIIERFGQLWCMTDQDRIFWSSANNYEPRAGDSYSEVGLQKLFNVWQSLSGGPLDSIDSVQALTYVSYRCKRDSSKCIRAGENHAYIVAEAGDFSEGQTLYPVRHGSVYEPNDIMVGGINQAEIALKNDVILGAFGCKLTKTDLANYVFDDDNEVRIVDDLNPSGEIVIITDAVNGSTSRTLSFNSALLSGYTVANNAKLIHQQVLKLEFTSNWDVTLGDQNHRVVLRYDDWNDITTDVDYVVSLDPDNDPDADGHIKLYDTQPIRDAVALRADLTEYQNPWKEGTSGFLDLSKHSGNNLAIAEGPDKNDAGGTTRLYLFKTNGDIYVIVGRPGPQGTQGSLDIEFLHHMSGRVRPKTIQTLPYGVMFAAQDGPRYDFWLMPHVRQELTHLYKMNANFHFDDVDFTNDSYEFSECCEVINGDQYIIAFPFRSGGGAVLNSFNNYMYICDVYQPRKGEVTGRWTRTGMHSQEEAEDQGLNNDPIVAAPITVGFHYQDGRFYRSYASRTDHTYSSSIRFVETARYSMMDGQNEKKDTLYYIEEIPAGGGYRVAELAAYYDHIIKSGAIHVANRVCVKRMFIKADISGGASGNGINLEWNYFTDIATTGIYAVDQTIDDLTDDVLGQKLLTSIDLSFVCKYFQFYLKFKNVLSTGTEPYISVRGVSHKVAVLSPEGRIAEEDY